MGRSCIGAACGLVLVAGALTLNRSVVAQASLPLENLGIEHLDIIVPDPAASARFYARVFRTTLHQQPVRDTLRYFVLLGDLPPDRQVGYIAIGAAQARAPCWRRRTRATRSRAHCDLRDWPRSRPRPALSVCGPIRTAWSCSCFSRRPVS